MLKHIAISVILLLGTALTLGTPGFTPTIASAIVSPLPTPDSGHFFEYAYIEDGVVVKVKPVNYYTTKGANTAFLSTHLGAEKREATDPEKFEDLSYDVFFAFYPSESSIFASAKSMDVNATWVLTFEYISVKDSQTIDERLSRVDNILYNFLRNQ